MKKIKDVLTKNNLLSMGLSFLAAATPIYGAYPFAVAAAAAGAPDIFVLLGCIAGCFVGSRIAPMGILAVVTVFFGLKWINKQSGALTLTHRIVPAAAVALMASIEGIVLDRDVTGLLLYMACHLVLTPAATFLFCHARRFDSISGSGLKLSVAYFCMFLLCRFADTVQIYSVSAALAVGCVLTLAVAQKKGFLFGGTAGLICGLASGAPAAGALAVMGMTYGMLHTDSEFLAALLSWMLTLSAYGYLASFEGMVPAAIMLVLCTLLFLTVRKRIDAPAVRSAREAKSENTVMLKRFAAAFSSLSGVFYTIGSSVRAPAREEIYRGISEAIEGCCNGCDGCGNAVRDISESLCDRIACGAEADASALPTWVRVYCPKADALVSAANGVKKSFDDVGREGLGRLSDEYRGLAALLDSAATREEAYTLRDAEGEKAADKALDELSVCRSGIALRGKRLKKLQVFGIDPNMIRTSSGQIRKTVGEALRQNMSEPVFRMHDGMSIMELTTLPKLRTESAKYIRAKQNETVSGDTVSLFETPDMRFCCLISDGMGSGEDASMSSRLSALVLEKLLKLGVETAPALNALNGALGEKQPEVFSTVDLLDADLVTATATLTKAGAAPTYFLRDGVCRTLTSATPPMGIMRDVYSESVTLSLQKGDCIVLVSDGALPDGGGSYITDILTGLKNPTAASVVARVSECAETVAGSGDDLSVCAVRFY